MAGTITTTGTSNAIQVNITQGQAGTTNNYGSIDIASTGQVQAAIGDGIHVFATSTNAVTSAPVGAPGRWRLAIAERNNGSLVRGARFAR